MFRFVFRAVLVLFGGAIVAKLVEMFLTSDRGQRFAQDAGLSDLTTYRGVELAQRYSRAIVGVIVGALVAVQETLEARAETARRSDWPERVQMYAQLLLAAGSMAKTVSDFLDERRQLLGEGAR
jgi:hypothetical protein